MAKLLATLAAISCMRAAADPRCRASGQYQNQPVVFACDGSGGDDGLDINVFKVSVKKGAERSLFEIPVGTSGFQIEVGAGHRGYMVLYDPVAAVNIVDDAFATSKVQKWDKSELNYNHPDASDMHFNTTWNGMRIVYSMFLTLPRKEQFRFLDPTPGRLQLRIMNPHDTEQVFRFRYLYDKYTSGPMCMYGAAPTGCEPFYQASARLLSVHWSNWLRRAYPEKEAGWTALTYGQNDPSLIPSYRWCNVYTLWNEGNPQDCWRVWKFISHGGFEANVPGFDRTMFEFAYNLSSVNTFATYCCGAVTSQFGDHEAAAQGLKHSASDGRFATGLWELCKDLPNAPWPEHKDNYLDKYMDADGYQGLLPSDLEYCYHQTNPSPPQTCVYKPPPGCSPQWTYKGATYSVCTLKNHDNAWCSVDPVYNNNWKSCLLTCEDEGSAQGCSWTPNAKCADSFTYRQTEYTGCTKVNHNSGWCSLDKNFQGKWQYCTWDCPAGVATVPPTTSKRPPISYGGSWVPRKISSEQMPPQAQPRIASAVDAVHRVHQQATDIVQKVAGGQGSVVARLRAAASRGTHAEGGGYAWMGLWMVLACIACVAFGCLMSTISFLFARLHSKPRVMNVATHEDELPLMPVNSTW